MSHLPSNVFRVELGAWSLSLSGSRDVSLCPKTSLRRSNRSTACRFGCFALGLAVPEHRSLLGEGFLHQPHVELARGRLLGRAQGGCGPRRLADGHGDRLDADGRMRFVGGGNRTPADEKVLDLLRNQGPVRNVVPLPWGRCCRIVPSPSGL
ncbi:hypothetical protein N6H14_25910 [Paenibacillus sp. CC-CFT747]|nr:hypothetical protein N6H14_25910 [Paenibacillus sp. CC-CFT747]